jgi:hypothetical protein
MKFVKFIMFQVCLTSFSELNSQLENNHHLAQQQQLKAQPKKQKLVEILLLSYCH